MPKRGRSKKVTQAIAEERAMKRIDRAVSRYGPGAVAKYYSGPSAMRPETKYFDTFFSQAIDSAADWGTSVVANTSYMASDGSTVTAYTDAALIPSAIGNGYGQVIGNKYIIKKLRIKGLLSFTGSDATTGLSGGSNVVRLMLVQDTQPNGAQVQANTFLTDWGSSLQVLNSFQSISSGTGGRFRVLYDRMFVLDPVVALGTLAGGNDTAMTGQTKLFKISKTFKKGLKVVVKSGSATPTVASLSDMNMFLVAHNSGTSGGAPQTLIVGNSRCYYMD